MNITIEPIKAIELEFLCHSPLDYRRMQTSSIASKPGTLVENVYSFDSCYLPLLTGAKTRTSSDRYFINPYPEFFPIELLDLRETSTSDLAPAPGPAAAPCSPQEIEAPVNDEGIIDRAPLASPSGLIVEPGVESPAEEELEESGLISLEGSAEAVNLSHRELRFMRREAKSRRKLKPKLRQCYYLKLLGPEGLERFLKDVLLMESFEVIDLVNDTTLLYRVTDRHCPPSCGSVLQEIRRRGCIPISKLFDLLCTLYLEGKMDRGDYLIQVNW